jgi:hypothetical protein
MLKMSDCQRPPINTVRHLPTSVGSVGLHARQSRAITSGVFIPVVLSPFGGYARIASDLSRCCHGLNASSGRFCAQRGNSRIADREQCA